MPTVTASAGPYALTSRRSGNVWSVAQWDASLALSGAIPSNATVKSAVLTVTVRQDPIVGSYCQVDGQTVRTAIGTYTINIDVSPGVSSRLVTVTFQGNGTTYTSSQMEMSLALSVVYEIQTTACGAPTSVTLDATIAETSTTLRWSGAKSGTGNAIVAYGIYYRDSVDGSTWGSWTGYTVVTSSATSGSVSAAAPSARGSYRQYRIHTRGSAGSAWYSDYAVSGSLRKNQAPPAPSMVYPASGTTNSLTPALLLNVGSDPDGQAVTLHYRIDGGDWVQHAGVQRLNLAEGEHTIAIKAVDSLGAETAGTSRSITVAPPQWTRAIRAGDVIANQTVSHRKDIAEMLAAANIQRAWYGLAPIMLDGVGAWSKWRQQMADLRQSIEACRSCAGLAAPTWAALTGYPTAAVINEIREGVKSA